MSFSRASILLCALVAFTAWLAAQQKSPFVPIAQMGTGATQVNTSLYGGGMTGSVKYAQTSRPMDSELRYAYVQSGALPSDIRAGYAAMGPMTPGGAIDYIPEKPAYLGKSSASVASVSPAGGGAYSAGSVRYAPTYSPASIAGPNLAGGNIGARSVSAGPMNAGPINAGPMNTGTIRYGR